jgi:hypothetical protein
MTTTTLHHKVQQVATHLSPWQYQSEYRGVSTAVLVHPDIADASVNFCSHPRGRITITGGFPRDFYPLPEHRPLITVSADRSPKSVAADIARRFLPTYVPLFEAMEAQARAWAQVQTRKNAALDAMAEVLGIPVYRYFDNRQEGELYHYGPETARIRARPTGSDDGVCVDLALDRLPLDVALQVCEVLREMLRPAPRPGG